MTVAAEPESCARVFWRRSRRFLHRLASQLILSCGPVSLRHPSHAPSLSAGSHFQHTPLSSLQVGCPHWLGTSRHGRTCLNLNGRTAPSHVTVEMNGWRVRVRKRCRARFASALPSESLPHRLAVRGLAVPKSEPEDSFTSDRIPVKGNDHLIGRARLPCAPRT